MHFDLSPHLIHVDFAHLADGPVALRHGIVGQAGEDDDAEYEHDCQAEPERAQRIFLHDWKVPRLRTDLTKVRQPRMASGK